MGEPLPEFDPEFDTEPAQWAAMYRACGWPVVPAWMPAEHQNFKHPKVTWRHYHAVIPQADHDAWYAKNGMHTARLNMGVLTGGPYKLLMIDLDTYKSPKALAWWREVIETENHGIEPETVRQRSGGGGQQLFFQVPADWHCPNAVTDIGVDIRCDGGFAMLPPSLHDSGNSYAWEAGFAPWEVHVDLAGQWLLDAVEALIEAHGGDVKYAAGNGATAHAASSGTGDEFTAWGKRWDRREHAMFRHVWHRVLEWAREPPGPTRPQPFPHDWEPRAREAYADYERNTDVAAQGKERGWSLYWGKWRAAMKQWGSAKMVEAAEQPAPKDETRDHAADFEEAAKAAEEKVRTDPTAIYPWLDVPAIKAMTDPVWNVVGLIPQQGVGFVYGPPGSLKSFLVMDLGLTIATKLPDWWGHKIECAGTVIYLSVEGMGHFKFRLMAWEQHRGVNADLSPFVLIKESINFLQKDDIGKLLATVQNIHDKLTVPITMVVVDTISRVLPGAEENLQKDMTIFVQACEAVYKRFGCVVVGIHHSNNQGGIRGSSVIPGAGDFLIEVKRSLGEMKGSIVARKVKDAEDGWEQFFTVDKVSAGLLGGTTSLVLNAVPGGTPKPDDWLPPLHTCREILAGMEDEWIAGRPWCFAKNVARWAVRNISLRWGLEPKNVERLLAHWVAKNVIAHDVCDAKKHVSGYRKLTDI